MLNLLFKLVLVNSLLSKYKCLKSSLFIPFMLKTIDCCHWKYIVGRALMRHGKTGHPFIRIPESQF